LIHAQEIEKRSRGRPKKKPRGRPKNTATAMTLSPKKIDGEMTSQQKTDL